VVVGDLPEFALFFPALNFFLLFGALLINWRLVEALLNLAAW